MIGESQWGTFHNYEKIVIERPPNPLSRRIAAPPLVSHPSRQSAHMEGGTNAHKPDTCSDRRVDPYSRITPPMDVRPRSLWR